MRMRNVVVFLVLGAVCVVFATLHAQSPPPFDHLKCYKIKDKRPQSKGYTADLLPQQNPPFDDQNCVIKTPAKYFCIDVQKTNVNPTPPGAPPGPDAADYLCYKFRGPCTPVFKKFPLQVTDQFGSGTIWIKKPAIVCAPAVKNTTTTTTSNTTTTTTTSSTTTTLPGVCQQGSPPQCVGACPDPAVPCQETLDTTDQLVCDCPCSDDGTGTGTCEGFCQDQNSACIRDLAGTCCCTCGNNVAGGCGGCCQDPTQICVDGGAAGCGCVTPCDQATVCTDGWCPPGQQCLDDGFGGCGCN